MICRNCGAEVPFGAVYCPVCGTPAEETDVSPFTGGTDSRDVPARPYSLLSPIGWFAVKGRMGKREFWRRQAWLFFLLFAVLAVSALIEGLLYSSADTGAVPGAIRALGAAAAALSALTILIRRMHDINCSAAIAVLVYLFTGPFLVPDLRRHQRDSGTEPLRAGSRGRGLLKAPAAPKRNGASRHGQDSGSHSAAALSCFPGGASSVKPLPFPGTNIWQRPRASLVPT